MILKSNTRISSSLKEAVEYLNGWYSTIFMRSSLNNNYKSYSNIIDPMDDDDNDDRND